MACYGDSFTFFYFTTLQEKIGQQNSVTLAFTDYLHHLNETNLLISLRAYSKQYRVPQGNLTFDSIKLI
jgi:hypothetical protein